MSPRRFATFLIAALLAIATIGPASTPGAPPPAAAFTNGHASIERDLAPIYDANPGDRAFLAKGAPAAGWNTLNLCAAAAGVPLSPGPSDFDPAATAYRHGRVQHILYQRHLNGQGPLAARVINFGSAHEVYTSNHGIGKANDLRNPPMQRYVIREGAPFNWSWGEVRSEWWHVTYGRLGGKPFGRPDPGASFRYPRLARGSGGKCQAPAVKELQKRLAELGHYGGRVDGEFGKSTSKGVRRLQQSKGFRKYLKKHKLKRSALGVVQSVEWITARKVTREITDENGGGSTVRPNSEGQDVRAAQGLLNARLNELHRGHMKVAVDGRWDDEDKRALRKFQSVVGLPKTGVVDPKTYAALRKPRTKAKADDSGGHHSPTRLDAAGLTFLAREEGRREVPYDDSAGHCTVGVGHLVHRGRCQPADFRRFKGFTAADSIALLRTDIQSRERAVLKLVTVRLNQNEFNALVSLVFNIGEGGFTTSTVRRELNAGHRTASARAFLLWRIGGPGLIFRRQREAKLFLTPVKR